MPAANPGYQVDARTVEDGVSVVTGKSAPPLSVDTSVGQSEDRFGPAELLAASLAACLLKNLTRLAAKMHLRYDRATVHVSAFREESPPRVSRLEYVLRIRTEESPDRIERLAELLRRYSTVYNTLSRACVIDGSVAVELPGNDAAGALAMERGRAP